MKIALITDQHFGARGSSVAFSNFFEKFYSTVFFPYLKENDINTIIDLGDTMDTRKFVNYHALHLCKKFWFDKIQENGYDLHVIVGNHCTFFKNTNEVNSPDLLLKEYDTIKVYSEPTDVQFDNLSISLVPWICSGNFDSTMDFLDSTRSPVLFGHLEIAGFEMYRGSVTEHGFDSKLFDKFDVVCSGHFHHKSSRVNINYLGAPYEMNWADWNDPRGFHIFDTDTRELTYIENPYKMFHKIHYDDSVGDMESTLDIDTSHLEGCYVKVITHSKNNPYWYDMFIDKIEQAGVLDLQCVDDNLNLQLESVEDIVDEAEDTLSILKKASTQIGDSLDETKQSLLNDFLTELYIEAQSSE